MATGYKEYNNYSQQDKDSIRTMDAETSNQNEATIIDQTDEVESLLGTTNSKLDTIAGKLDSIIGYIDQLESKADAIVSAINALPHNN